MKKIISTTIVGATALATSLGIMVLGSGVAGAATPTPPWQNATSSPNSVASLALYDKTGDQVTHGSIMDSPVALYAQASGVLHAGDTKAGLFFRTASSTVNPGDWAGEQLGNFSTYPLTTGPANVVAGSNFPTATNAVGDDSIAAYIAGNGSTPLTPMPVTRTCTNSGFSRRTVALSASTTPRWTSRSAASRPTRRQIRRHLDPDLPGSAGCSFGVDAGAQRRQPGGSRHLGDADRHGI